jgi:predicted TIM-barrel fold metal-dependent hydrolase
MHGGDQFYLETIRVMLKYPQVYTDISVISNPDIVPADRFAYLMNGFLDARLGNRLMFGTDNGDINKVIAAIESLSFLTEEQKSSIYHENAERFFRMK